MVTQEGTTITIPAHELATQGAHSVTMVTADGTDEQVKGKSDEMMNCVWAAVDLCNFVALRWPS